MALNYSTYIAELATLLVTQPTSAGFVAILPGIIDSAEQKIYRELDLAYTNTVDTSKSFTAGNRSLELATFVTLQHINVITPVGATVTNGARNPLVPVDQSYLDSVWNSSAGSGVPKNFALLSQSLANAPTIIVGPWPDQNYNVEAIGTVRPTPLSATNTTTFLTLYLPDLFIDASMIFAAGYQKNFGAQADDPKMAMSWQQKYDRDFASANAEELRRKFAGPGWTSESEVAAPAER